MAFNGTEVNGSITEYQISAVVLWPSTIAAGSTYLLISVVLSCLYVIVIQAMRATDELAKNSCYILMCSLGVVDMIQMSSVGFYTSLMILNDKEPSFYTSKFMGAVAAGLGWNSGICTMNVLSFNRFTYVILPDWNKKMFGSPFKTYCWVIACVSYGFSWFAMSLLPGVSNVFKPEILSWFYEGSHAATFAKLQLAQNMFHISCMTIFYISIIFFIRKISTNQGNGANSASSTSKERSLILQAFLVCFITATDIGIWNVVPYLSAGARPMGFVSTLLWIINIGCNPLIYIGLNPTVRHNFIKILVGGQSQSREIKPTTNQGASRKPNINVMNSQL